MQFFVLSLVLLWLAPIFYYFAQRYTRTHRVIERILVVAVALPVVIGILPESVAIAGWAAVLLAGLGMFLPSLLERVWHKMAVQVHWVPFVVGTLGLGLHAAMDGAAFFAPCDHFDFSGHHHAHTHMHFLPAAIVVHKLFEGLFLWWALRPRFGLVAPIAALLFVSIFTGFGFWAGDWFFHELGSAESFALFQALVAGSILHLAFDRHDPNHHHHHDHHHDHHHSDLAEGPAKNKNIEYDETSHSHNHRH